MTGNCENRASQRKSLAILGTRGIPAAHGGFETFCQRLSLYLASRGWEVTVYCQDDAELGSAGKIIEDIWNGVHRIRIPVAQAGALGTIVFDAKATAIAARRGTPALILGYNTAIFASWLRARRVRVIMNMDGIEWKRAKWSAPAKLWLMLNELLGSWLSNHLIADHPEIAKHLETKAARRRITMIPYGADEIFDAQPAELVAYGLKEDSYYIAIGRIEPENSVLEIVSAFSRKPRRHPLICLGRLDKDNKYHQQVLSAASDQVIFPGAIYEQQVVASLRRFARAYCHGHTVGGTNPSLVEALGAGSAVIAHDNKYNRWVAGADQFYFADEDGAASAFALLEENDAALARARSAALTRFRADFTWPPILSEYEQLATCYQS